MSTLTPVSPSFFQLICDPRQGLAFGFGSGLAPVAPGTFGTLAAIPFFLFMQHWPWPLYGGAFVVSFLLGIYLCEHSAKVLRVHDHPGIVWDEMVGLWITLFAAPTGWQWLVLGFLLFRLFDIVKPWPISWVDRRIGGGLGIMLDDVLAGVIACGVLQILAAVV